MNSLYLKIAAGLMLFGAMACQSRVTSFEESGKEPSIFPDYAGIVIPPNIAPLNFSILEAGTAYEARIYADKGKPVVVRSREGSIRINPARWRRLLEENRGSELTVELFVRTGEGKWMKYLPIRNRIAREEIDSHLVYRLINTGYVLWNQLGIYQRNLENFDEKPVLENQSIGHGCLNCHSFSNNDPNHMMIHIRAINGGTLINREGTLSKVDTKTPWTLSAGAYPCWHPGGKHIAFSVNNIGQYFCAGDIRIEVADEKSDLVVYDIETNSIITSPVVSTASRENLPAWSPDGRTLYFLSAPPVSNTQDRIGGQYDLLRVGFDAGTRQWGSVDTVLSHRQLGQSISFPKISPDGKFLMYCTSDKGYFTIHHPQSDLNLLNLETGEYRKMEINSPHTESYHSFSSGGHWFVFTSKRLDGLFARPFFSYLDEKGRASKPFVLPQKDPAFYHTFIKNYNIPELLRGPVTISPLSLRNKVIQPAVPARLDASVDTAYMRKHLSGGV